MKVLVIMGSPRKKDGYNISKILEGEINKNSEVEFEYIFLKDQNIEDCRGCNLCFQKGEEYCNIKDDINHIKQKLIDADGIIFVSPVYAYQVTGVLKRFIDRLSYLFHRPELVGKPALTIVTTAGGGQKHVTKYLKMTACGWGCHLVNDIEIVSTMFFDGKGYNGYFSKKYYDKSMKIIENSSKDFYEAMKSRRLPKPGFYEILMFNGLRSKTFTSKADYKFWESKGWLDSAYYYEVKINPVKKLFGALMDRWIKSMWIKMQKE